MFRLPIHALITKTNHPIHSLMKQGAKRKRAIWSQEERDKFLKLYMELGRSYAKYIPSFPGRSYSQIAAFYHNNSHELERLIHPETEAYEDKETE